MRPTFRRLEDSSEADTVSYNTARNYYSWFMKYFVTGGAGFIGSHVVRLFVKKYPDYKGEDLFGEDELKKDK